MCTDKPVGNECHGPHLYEEWWVAGVSDAANTSAWRRSHRRTKAAPRDAFLMAQPVGYADSMLWVGSTGSVYTLPQFRIAGLYAPANGEISTQAFTMPTAPLSVNADVHWDGMLNTSYDGIRGCDEGCAAYLFASVLDAVTGIELPGYGVNESIVQMDVDGLRLPLLWRTKSNASDYIASNTTSATPANEDQDVVGTTALAGRRVQLRLYFRDATIYAVSADE